MNKDIFNKKDLLSIPNIMGYFRLILIPCFCIAWFSQGKYSHLLAIVILIVSSITDLLDGLVARKFNMITEFGKFLDPVADKLTHGAIALCLCFSYKPMLYLLILMAIKEGLMALLGLINLKHDVKLDGAKWFGKVCTATLFILLCFLVVFYPVSNKLSTGLIYGEMVIMLITLLLYLPTFYKMKKAWQ